MTRNSENTNNALYALRRYIKDGIKELTVKGINPPIEEELEDEPDTPYGRGGTRYDDYE